MAYQVPQFDDAKDKWSSYYTRVESYFEGDGIVDDAKKRALLISALSSKPIDVLSGRCAPRKRIMDSVLNGLPGVQAYFDDVLVAEKGNNGRKNLKAVLPRFREYGIKLRKDKCTFRMPEVSYHGHKISTGGLQPLEKNMDAVMRARTPRHPLVGLFREDRPTPIMAAARIQHWSLLLGAYQYKIEYEPGSDNLNADALSRPPLETTDDTSEELHEFVHSLQQLEDMPLSSQASRQFTEKVQVLGNVNSYILHGWPKKYAAPDP
ncbi:uncharacterized protein [Dermacentor andersoni]|uniref:uncharacterized protein n=1 Tax=Dermacentor andersoni TaxID=34620 RepID=UPI003B3A864B